MPQGWESMSTTPAPEHLAVIGDIAAVLPQLVGELAGKVTAVYIDPPYDHSDGGRRGSQRLFAYADRREGAWADFIRDRITMALPLLNPAAPVAVSIGHRRVHELAMILTGLLPTYELVTITVDQGRAPTDAVGVQRSAEYVLIAVPPGVRLGAPGFTSGEVRTGWSAMTLASHPSTDYPNQHYPVFVDETTGRIVGVGPSTKQLAGGAAPVDPPAGSVPILPITNTGKDVVWRISWETFTELYEAGMVRADRPRMPGNRQPFVVKYVTAGTRKRIAAGEIATHGRDEHGARVLDRVSPEGAAVPSVWRGDQYTTRAGTIRLDQLLGHGHGFAYPKAPALVADILTACTGGARDAVILDFFAGSGTTLDAVHALNAADGGTRRAILIQQDEGTIVDTVLLPRAHAVLAGSPTRIETRRVSTPVTGSPATIR